MGHEKHGFIVLIFFLLFPQHLVRPFPLQGKPARTGTGGGIRDGVSLPVILTQPMKLLLCQLKLPVRSFQFHV